MAIVFFFRSLLLFRIVIGNDYDYDSCIFELCSSQLVSDNNHKNNNDNRKIMPIGGKRIDANESEMRSLLASVACLRRMGWEMGHYLYCVL